MNEHPQRTAVVVVAQRAIVLVHLLGHSPAGSQTHVNAGRGGHGHAVPQQVGLTHHTRFPLGSPRRQRLLGETDGTQLNASMGLLPGDLSFDRGAGTQRHGDELADEAVPGVDPVEPRLPRQRDVVLRIPDEVIDPRQAAHRAHLPDADLQGRGFRRVERQPHRLTLIDRQHHAPRCNHSAGAVSG